MPARERTSTDQVSTAEARRPEVLDPDACRRLLERAPVGRLGFVAEDGPVVVPVNYCLHRGDPVFRVETGGHLERWVCGRDVALEVDELDATSRSGESVLVRGTAKAFLDGPALARRGGLELTPWAPGRRARYLRIPRARVTGRRVSADLPALWLG